MGFFVCLPFLSQSVVIGAGGEEGEVDACLGNVVVSFCSEVKLLL